MAVGPVFASMEIMTMLIKEILDPASTLHKSPPNLIVLALILEQMDPVYKLPAWTADEMKDRLKTLYNHLLEKTSLSLLSTLF